MEYEDLQNIRIRIVKNILALKLLLLVPFGALGPRALLDCSTVKSASEWI